MLCTAVQELVHQILTTPGNGSHAKDVKTEALNGQRPCPKLRRKDQECKG